MLVSLEQCVLYLVLRIFPITQNGNRKFEAGALVPARQFREGLAVSLLCGKY